jgi:hypothetical protein
MRPLHLVLLVAATCATIAGCTDSGDTATGSATSTTTSAQVVDVLPTTAAPPVESSLVSTPAEVPTSADVRDELENAVTTYSDAFLDGDPVAAYGMFSARCKEAVSLSYFTGIVTAAKQTYGAALPIRSFDVNLSESIALVTYTYDMPALNQAGEPWVLEGGTWKLDECG